MVELRMGEADDLDSSMSVSIPRPCPKFEVGGWPWTGSGFLSRRAAQVVLDNK